MAASSDRWHDDLPGAATPYGFDVLRMRTGTTLRIVVSGEVDLATVPVVRGEIEQTRDRDVEIVALDLQRVTFMD